MTVPRSMQNGATRDVEAELAKQRAEKRRLPGSASPVQFHKDLLVGDDWHCMFLSRLCGGVSMKQFDAGSPPNVLDLGSGSGLWAIEAAKAWPDSKIIGFDRRDVQPDLTQLNLGIEYRDLSKRVIWMHGNFLEPLPFESDHFDFVRICCIGLEVPEDSWQELLEECARVMKPGAVLEVLEEDPLFPAGKSLRPDAERKPSIQSVHSLTADRERVRADSTATTYTTATTHTTRTQSSTASSSRINITTEHSTNSASIDSYYSSSTDGSADSTTHVQDHLRLKRSWEKMLDQHFLTHKLTTVLPLYLTSFFKNVQVHPTMYILLPPPSHLRADGTPEREHALEEDDAMRQWVEDMRAGMVRIDGDHAHLSSQQQHQHNQQQQRRSTAQQQHAALRTKAACASVTMWSTLHLARQTRLVAACKEAIWEAYQALAAAAADEPSGALRGEPGGALHGEPLRDEFERDWQAWENDMKDRVGIRNHVQDALAWQDPDTYSDRASSFFRSSQSFRGYSLAEQQEKGEKAAVCRSLRGFVAWKA